MVQKILKSMPAFFRVLQKFLKICHMYGLQTFLHQDKLIA